MPVFAKPDRKLRAGHAGNRLPSWYWGIWLVFILSAPAVIYTHLV